MKIVKYSLISLSIVFLITIAFSPIKKHFFPKPSVKISYQATSVDSLIKDSALIITAHVTNDDKKITYSNVDFIKTRIEVKEALKGADFSQKEIYLLQTVCNEDPIVKKGSDVLLFLEKYEGPVTDNSYICRGLYQGQYKLDGIKINPIKDDNKNLTNTIKNIDNLDNLKEKIKTLK